MLPALLGAASLPAGEGNAPPPAQQTPTFVDVAEESGVDLLTLSGTPYKAYIVESTTGGTSVFDYDNDGDVDIYIVNGSRLAGFAEAAAPRATLYRNDGNWRFFRCRGLRPASITPAGAWVVRPPITTLMAGSIST